MRIILTVLAMALSACGPSPPAPSQTPQSAPAQQAETPDAAALQAAVAALPAPYNEASYEAGRRVFAQCRSCHTIDAGGANAYNDAGTSESIPGSA